MNPASPLLRLAAVSLALFAAGCASPGPPHPPSLNLPAVVKDLAAQRSGDAVDLHWTTPDKTTDHIDIKGALTAEVCRVDPAVSQDCVTARRLIVRSGPSETSDILPNTLTTGAPALLAYRIRIYNAHGRSAELSPPAWSAAGAAPPPVGSLRASSARTGAVLEWQPQNTPGFVQIDRRLQGAPIPPPHASGSSAKLPHAKPTQKATSPQAAPKAPFSAVPAGPAEVKLKTPDQPTDPGGTLDQTAKEGEAYIYTARRIHTVTLQGHALELRSLISQPITLRVHDTFPPRVPAGLEAVPGDTAGSSARSIDLSWEPSPDADLAGYNVYRQAVSASGQPAGAFTRVNSALVPGPAWRDQTAQPGQRYVYHVTAVDTVGNESGPGNDVQEILSEP